MSTTTFIDGQSVIYASWLNDVNAAVYNGTFPNGIINLTTLNSTNINGTTVTATNGVFTNLTFSSLTQVNLPNNWVISTTPTKLIFSNNGTNVASIDTSGNFRALTSTISGTTP
jgi:hypothetical protein